MLAALARRPKRSILEHHRLHADYELEPIDLMLIGARLSELGERYGDPTAAFPFHAIDPDLTVGELIRVFEGWAAVARSSGLECASGEVDEPEDEPPPSTERMFREDRISAY